MRVGLILYTPSWDSLCKLGRNPAGLILKKTNASRSKLIVTSRIGILALYAPRVVDELVNISSMSFRHQQLKYTRLPKQAGTRNALKKKT